MSPQGSGNGGQNLAEIGHLVLTSVRERQVGGAARPVRVPPGGQRMEATAAATVRRDVSIDMTAEEFAAQMAAASGMQIVRDDEDDACDAPDEVDAPAEERKVRAKPVAVVIGGHLGEELAERAGEYARHVARAVRRVGVVYVDEGGIRVCCVDGSSPSGQSAEEATIEQVAGALGELNWDVNRWVVVGADVRPMLEEARSAVLLCSCGHEGVVSAYRTLKGLAEVRPGELGVALLDAREHAEAGRVQRKISSVAEQYLGCAVRMDAVVIASADFHEHELLTCECEPGEAWAVLRDFFAGAEEMPKVVPTAEKSPEEREVERAAMAVDAAAPAVSPVANAQAVVAQIASDIVTPITAQAEPAPAMRMASAASSEPEVIELGAGMDVVSAVVRHAGAGLVGCPAVKPPMMESGAEVAVTRERRLVLVAVAGEGLAGLEKVARAHRWLVENRSLVAMALPQMNVDAHQLPELRVLVDWQDAGAEGLRSLVGAGHVTVQTYRKLRWGGKTGVLVEAA